LKICKKSLEISDKKSYSGVFTKVIPLNSKGALSNKRIIGNSYSQAFKRNINIKEGANGSFTYSDNAVRYDSPETGWVYTNGGKPIDDDDCGALYSNILYGVKAYFRRTKGE
jgi:hypothetical protein